YWPGGSRLAAASGCRRPRKPREMNGSLIVPPGIREGCPPAIRRRPSAAVARDRRARPPRRPSTLPPAGGVRQRAAREHLAVQLPCELPALDREGAADQDVDHPAGKLVRLLEG